MKKPRNLQDVNKYGPDFRNAFNLTPLMIASRFGHVELAQKLCELGADTALVQNTGLTAFQIALQQAVQDTLYARTKLPPLYRLLAPAGLSTQVEQKLIKLDNHTAEFLLLNIAMLLFYQCLGEKVWHTFGERITHNKGLNAKDFVNAIAHLPDSVLPPWRKRQSYISGILSKNEAGRDDKYNRKLFHRVAYGQYIINPQLQLKLDEQWLPIYQVLDMDYLYYAPFLHRQDKHFYTEVEQLDHQQFINKRLDAFKQQIQQQPASAITQL